MNVEAFLQHTELEFASFLSGGFTIAIINKKAFFTKSANLLAKIGSQPHLKFGAFSAELSAHILSGCVTSDYS